MRYKTLPKSWKYETIEEHRFTLTRSIGKSIATKHIDIRYKEVVIRPGFRWNGPSFAIDTENAMLASCLHDAMYHLMEMGHLEQKWRKLADKMYRRILKAEGMSWFRRWYHWAGVRIGGGAFSRRANQ